MEIQNVRSWRKASLCEDHAKVWRVRLLCCAVNGDGKVSLLILSRQVTTECVQLELTTAVPWITMPVAPNGIEREQLAFCQLVHIAAAAEKVQFPAEYRISGLAAGTACRRRLLTQAYRKDRANPSTSNIIAWHVPRTRTQSPAEN
jgi:hypothetical protein